MASPSEPRSPPTSEARDSGDARNPAAGLQTNARVPSIAAPGKSAFFASSAWSRTSTPSFNDKSVFLTAKFAIPHMEKQRSGSIVNIGSINGVRTIPFPKLACAASKAAMIAISREIAIQYAPVGIRNNVVLVGLIKAPIFVQDNTNLYGGEVEEMWRKRDAMSPTGKRGEVHFFEEQLVPGLLPLAGVLCIEKLIWLTAQAPLRYSTCRGMIGGLFQTFPEAIQQQKNGDPAVGVPPIRRRVKARGDSAPSGMPVNPPRSSPHANHVPS